MCKIMSMWRRVFTYLRNKCQFNDVFWHIGKNNVILTTCFYTLANTMSILRRVLTIWQQPCEFYGVFWHIGKTNVNVTTCFDIFTKKCQFDDVFLMVRTLKYGTVARFFRKCTKNVDETRPEPSGTLRAKYGIYWWKKRQCYDVFLHMYEKIRQLYDVFWHIGKNLVNFTTCFDTFSKTISILRRVFEGQNAEVRYCCTIFSKKYEKRRRDAPGSLRAGEATYWPGLLP